MVKILERGKFPDEEEYRVRCDNCKTLFSFIRKEATHESSYFDHRDGYFTTLKISCPLCNQRVTKYVTA